MFQKGFKLTDEVFESELPVIDKLDGITNDIRFHQNFGVAQAGENKNLVVSSYPKFEDERQPVMMEIFDIEQRKHILKDELLSTKTGWLRHANYEDFWLQLKDRIYYFKITQTTEEKTEKIDLMQLNMLTEEKLCLLETKFEPQEMNLLMKQELNLLNRVDAINFVKNKTGKTLQITQHFVALLCVHDNDLSKNGELGEYISFRKVSDLNKEIFTVDLEILHFDNVSFSQYENRDGQKVIVLKSVNSTSNLIKVYIEKEEIWSVVETDESWKLAEQMKNIEKEARIDFQDEIIND